MLPMLVLMALAGFFIGPLGRVLSARTQVVAGSVLIAGSTASIALFHAAVWELTIAAALFGLGLGLVFAAMTAVVVQSVPATQTGIATGMNANLRTIGSGIGTALMTAIVTGSAVPGAAAGEPTEAGYTLGFLVLAAGALVAAIIAGVSRPNRVRVAAPEPIAESPFLDAEAA
jgi:MFS family permease